MFSIQIQLEYVKPVGGGKLLSVPVVPAPVKWRFTEELEDRSEPGTDPKNILTSFTSFIQLRICLNWKIKQSSQLTFACSKTTIETLERGVNSVLLTSLWYFYC